MTAPRGGARAARLPPLASLALLALAAVAATAVAAEFDVVFDTRAPLGMKLDASLLVTGFARAPGTGARLPAEASGWVRAGDRVVAVAGERVEGRAIADVAQLIARAEPPKTLRFAAAGGGDRVSEMAAV
jgi:hypothetical protein